MRVYFSKTVYVHEVELQCDIVKKNIFSVVLYFWQLICEAFHGCFHSVLADN